MQYLNQIQIHRINNRHYTFPLSSRITWKQIIQVNLLLLPLLRIFQNLPQCSYNKLIIFAIQPPMKKENFDILTCSPLIKWAFTLPLIHYIVNTDTNLNNATITESISAASNNNLIMVHFPVLPIPPTPRTVSVNSSTSNNFNAPTGTRIPCNNLSPFWIKYASSLVFLNIPLISPR